MGRAAVDPKLQGTRVVNVEQVRIVAPCAILSVLGLNGDGIYLAVARFVTAACAEREITEGIAAGIMAVIAALAGVTGIIHRLIALRDQQAEQVGSVCRGETVEIGDIPADIHAANGIEDIVAVELVQLDFRGHGFQRNGGAVFIIDTIERGAYRYVQRIHRRGAIMEFHNARGQGDGGSGAALGARDVLVVNLRTAAGDGYVENGGRFAVLFADVAGPVDFYVLTADGLERGFWEIQEGGKALLHGDGCGFPLHLFAGHAAIWSGKGKFADSLYALQRNGTVLVYLRYGRITAAPNKLRERIFFIRQRKGSVDYRLILHVNVSVAVFAEIIHRITVCIIYRITIFIRFIDGKLYVRYVALRDKHGGRLRGGCGFAHNELTVYEQLHNERFAVGAVIGRKRNFGDHSLAGNDGIIRGGQRRRLCAEVIHGKLDIGRRGNAVYARERHPVGHFFNRGNGHLNNKLFHKLVVFIFFFYDFLYADAGKRVRFDRGLKIKGVCVYGGRSIQRMADNILCGNVGNAEACIILKLLHNVRESHYVARAGFSCGYRLAVRRDRRAGLHRLGKGNDDRHDLARIISTCGNAPCCYGRRFGIGQRKIPGFHSGTGVGYVTIDDFISFTI